VLPHNVEPPRHDTPQLPVEHTWPAGHAFPHVPQLVGSLVVSTHVLLQSVEPPEQRRPASPPPPPSVSVFGALLLLQPPPSAGSANASIVTTTPKGRIAVKETRFDPTSFIETSLRTLARARVRFPWRGMPGMCVRSSGPTWSAL
jgi:hypothetical protein